MLSILHLTSAHTSPEDVAILRVIAAAAATARCHEVELCTRQGQHLAHFQLSESVFNVAELHRTQDVAQTWNLLKVKNGLCEIDDARPMQRIVPSGGFEIAEKGRSLVAG
ncbi:hypothetical protein IFU01_18245 [Oxalobacteraceae sp. CFBP 8763]|nr:hypothetical protein [Oxalobacteraceae sp. CFBP 8763]